MKCVQCGIDNTLKDRTSHGGRCKNCNHKFVFEPTAMSGIRFTDPFFAKALNDVSANNTLYFTSNQLFYLLEKRLHKKQGSPLVGGGVLLIFFGIILAISGVGFFLIGAGVVVLLISFVKSKLPSKRPRPLVIQPSTVEQWLQRWSQVNGSPEKLLSPPRDRSIAPAQSAPTDVTAYSFDRLVVCDSVPIAQMLIANNFHFENNCAILSISGYPESIFETTMQMLRRNSDLRIFALHSCSPSGMEMIHQLRTNSAWFADSDAVMIDVGLFPRQITATKKKISIQQSDRSAQAAKILSPEIRQALSKAELEWLDAGNTVSLESFTPQALIQILQRSIANSQAIGVEDGSASLVGDGDYGYLYVDSFG